MNEVTFEDPVIGSKVQRYIGHGSPFSKKELSSITGSFHVDLVEKLEVGLHYLDNVTWLWLERACFDELSGLYELPDWARIKLTKTNLSDLDWVRSHENLESLDLNYGFIEDISPLLELPNLKGVGLEGNPLSEESYYEVLPKLEERVNTLDYSEEDVWKLQRRMWEAGHRASYHYDSPYEKRGTLVVPELYREVDREKFEHDKDWAVEGKLTPDRLREELDEPNADIAEIARRYWKPPYRRQDFVDRGDTEQARGWIDASQVDEAIGESLLAFVDRFDGAEFVREKTKVTGRRYPYYYEPTDEDPDRLPMWYQHAREALAFPELAGASAVGVFSEDTSRVPEMLVGEPVDLQYIGPDNDAARIAFCHRHWFFPVAYAGRDLEYALGIKLDAEQPSPVYVARMDEALRWSFDPYAGASFEGLGSLFDAIEAIEPRAALLSEEAAERERAPAVYFSGPTGGWFDSSQMRGRIKAADVDDALRESLLRFVEDFPTLEWTSESEEKIEYWEVWNLERFPDWYRQLRKLMAAFHLPDGHSGRTYVEFGHPKLNEEYQLSSPRLTESSHLDYYVRQHRLLQIGSGTYDLLFIRLDGADRGIYSYDIEVAGDIELNIPRLRKYDDIAQMFDDIVAVTDGAERRLER